MKNETNNKMMGLRLRGARSREDLAHVLLGLADVHVEKLGPLDGDEVERALGRDRLRKQRLARPGRAVEEDS